MIIIIPAIALAYLIAFGFLFGSPGGVFGSVLSWIDLELKTQIISVLGIFGFWSTGVAMWLVLVPTEKRSIDPLVFLGILLFSIAYGYAPIDGTAKRRQSAANYAQWSTTDKVHPAMANEVTP